MEEKKTKTPRPDSYQTKIRKAMAAHNGVISQDVLCSEVGADKKNLAVSVSIIRNPDRTKEPMKIAYSRKHKTFYDLSVKKAADAYVAAIKEVEDAKKAKKKTKKAKA